ncbi:histidine kinase [Streptomyces sp. YS415]|uniref:sensor histidine kinase n=1 Tax=Streptomyces sp. YS415 TaxID=2944806 RepID=UPI002020E496|nr:histidine kinase [Streptomyces sp. YS415]MCL7430520.1 histidine kinase [Streptomyces sp. YS415]
MESIRNWLLPTVLTLPNAGILAIVLSSGEVSGVLLPAGMVAGFVLQLVALGRRRSEPLVALAGTVAGMLIGTLAAPEHFANLAVFVALYSVAVRCGGRTTALCTVIVVGCVWLPDLLYGSSAAAALTQLGITASMYVPCAGLGEARRQWLSGRWAAAGKLARAEEERRHAADNERHRLARELHDVSAHHLTSVVVTVDAARRLGSTRPELAEEAMEFAVRTGEETLSALRRLADAMRHTEAPDPRPMSGRMRELITGFSRLGRPVEADLPDDLAGPAAEAAFGIVREALTNTLRHAPGAPVRVEIRRADGALHLLVANGAPRAAEERTRATTGLGSGNGLTGMRERATSAGGELTAQPDGDGGWRVTAALPDTTGPVRPDTAVRRRDLRREQRLADVLLGVTAVTLPLYVTLSGVADGALPGDTLGALVLTLLLTVHALPLLWRRSAPAAALTGVAATAWLVPAAFAAGLMPSDWAGLLPSAMVTEAMAVYAVAAYGRRAARALGAALAAVANLVTALTVTAATADILVLPRDEPGAVSWTAWLILCVTGPLLVTLWAVGTGVRRRRIRVVTREEDAFSHSLHQAALEAAAERRLIAAELHETVLRCTTRMVALAGEKKQDEVAAEARAALAAMRELLRSLRGATQTEGHHSPQPVAADLAELCRVLRATGRDVSVSGLPRAVEDLPVPVSLTVYRVVEAALGAGDRGAVRVTLRRRRGQVHIAVTGVPLAAAGPVAERLRVQAESAAGRMSVDRAGTLRVSIPAGNVPALV